MNKITSIVTNSSSETKEIQNTHPCSKNYESMGVHASDTGNSGSKMKTFLYVPQI